MKTFQLLNSLLLSNRLHGAHSLLPAAATTTIAAAVYTIAIALQRVLLVCAQRWKARLLEVCELLQRDAAGVALAFQAFAENHSAVKRRAGSRVMPQTVDEVCAKRAVCVRVCSPSIVPSQTNLHK